MSALTAFYDLAHGPVSFDVVTWLIRARMIARDAGHEQLHAVIVPHESGLGGFSRHWGSHDEAATRWRLWHIVIPACQLAGATVAVAPSRAHAEHLRQGAYWWPEGKAHFLGPVVEAARKGAKAPLLKASAQARRYVDAWLKRYHAGRVVTLTMRQQATDPARNSNLAEWSLFSDWLAGQGWRVVELRDTEVALRDGRGWVELDLDLRLALYEAADMNVVGNNGPTVLMWHSSAPYMTFGSGLPDPQYRAHWAKHLSLKTGDQLPWATRKQRLVYRPDTFEIMREEFDRWAGATS